MISKLEEDVRSLGPASVLDVGCGCGLHLTTVLARHCARVVAVDITAHPSTWQEAARSHAVEFCRMDAVALGFAGGAFPLVVERASLHHIARWPDALSEMIRVSSDRVLIEEPIDDPRSEAKQRAQMAQELLLRVQAEVGYPHYLHLDPGTLLSAVRGRAHILSVHVEKCDDAVSFDDFFWSFPAFAAKSNREEYWLTQLQELRARFGGSPLCEDDSMTILATKDPRSVQRLASGL